MIQLKNISKIYGKNGGQKVTALDNANLTIEKGEFVAIIGASGSGKSTMMNILGMLDRPTSGEYYLENKEISTLTDDELAKIRNKKIGFVFQSFLLTPNLTAVENVEFPMVLVDKSESYRVNRARELLKNVGLGERLNHLPYQLSGGQKQRVAIARALSNNPSIILADEPTGNLDSTTGKDVINLFKELWKKGTTLVIVTHDPMLAKEAPRSIHILDGRVINDAHNEKIGGVSK